MTLKKSRNDFVQVSIFTSCKNKDEVINLNNSDLKNCVSKKQETLFSLTRVTKEVSVSRNYTIKKSILTGLSKFAKIKGERKTPFLRKLSEYGIENELSNLKPIDILTNYRGIKGNLQIKITKRIDLILEDYRDQMQKKISDIKVSKSELLDIVLGRILQKFEELEEEQEFNEE